MGYEIIKSLSIRGGKVRGSGASNNLYPRLYEEFTEDSSLQRMLDTEGQEAVEKTILMLYFERSWQPGSHNKYSKTANWFAFNNEDKYWASMPRYSNYSSREEYQESREKWGQNTKDSLYKALQRYKKRTIGKFVLKRNSGYYRDW